MGDVAYPPEKEPTRAEAIEERVNAAVEGIDRLYRSAVAGEEHNPVRRKTLFLVAALGIVANLPIVALLAVLMLAMTDDSVA